MNNRMESLCEKILPVNLVDIKAMRKYNKNTPSITGLLGGLIDGYFNKDDPKVAKALDNGTNVHKFLESYVNEQPDNANVYNSDVKQMLSSGISLMQYIKTKSDGGIAEKKISIEGTLGTTIDYHNISTSGIELIEFKTSKNIKVIPDNLKLKYELQLAGQLFNLILDGGNDISSFTSLRSSIMLFNQNDSSRININIKRDHIFLLSILILYYQHIIEDDKGFSISVLNILKFFNLFKVFNTSGDTTISLIERYINDIIGINPILNKNMSEVIKKLKSLS